MESHKIELILFYTDWCQHCRAIVGSPDKAWNQLETMYANHPTVQIRKIGEDQFESYSNKITDYEKPQINGFPMIIRIEGNRCEVYDSSNARSVNALKLFIEKPQLVNQCIIL